jgi:exosortase A-associated hydrolase 2
LALCREAFFIPAAKGERFALLTRPEGEPFGTLLFLHAFAEEMNKSRRMVAVAARSFAHQGWAVLQLDCFGCGDSAGDFGDAGWQDWLGDVSLGWDWLAENLPGRRGIWAMRAGALLAAEWMCDKDVRAPLLLWQPVTNGKQFLTQFLRLKVAEEMIGDAEAKADMARVRADLAAGLPVEIAGYTLSPGLADAIGAASFRLPSNWREPILIYEVQGEGRMESSPAVAALAERSRSGGARVEVGVAEGPRFWQTQEIETVPELIVQSVAGLRSLSA